MKSAVSEAFCATDRSLVGINQFFHHMGEDSDKNKEKLKNMTDGPGAIRPEQLIHQW